MAQLLPTEEAYGELQLAYDHFNRTLFGSELPPCLITFQREKRTYGYFSHARFESAGTGDMIDEIAINPSYFAVVPVTEIMQTLVHEMAHLWQAHFGTPGRRGYHNRQWAEKMEAIGLMPSDTGQPGGRKVGEKMADYPIEGGSFSVACEELLTGDYTITWRDRFPAQPLRHSGDAGDAQGSPSMPAAEVGNDKSNRKKYTCPTCGSNTWGKPGLKLICGECRTPLGIKGQSAQALNLLTPNNEIPVSDAGTQPDHEWSKGYYCAVAALLREAGCVTPDVRLLFKQGSGAEYADNADAALFRSHGLIHD